MINVFITDDHPSIIHGLRQMLGASGDIRVTGAFATGKELLAALEQELPHVLLLDIHLPDIAGNRLARMVSELYPQVGMLAFTNMNTDFHVQDMLSNGCLGYLLKTADTPTVISAVREVYHGRKFLEHPLTTEVKYNLMQAGKRQTAMLPALTKREQEVLRLICAGKTNQQIAEALFLSLRTIENHRFNLQQKLRVKNTVELMRVVMHTGLAD